jgi:hypothetical protein
MTVKDAAGRAVKSVTAAPPIALGAEATLDDVKRGLLWRLSIAYPKGAAAVTGTVTVKSPGASAAQLAQVESSLSSVKRTAPSQTDAGLLRHRATVAQAVATFTKADSDRLSGLQQQVSARYAQATNDLAVRRSTATLVPPALKGMVATSAVASLTTAQQNALASGIATLLQAVPPRASPGERVVLRGKNLGSNPAIYQAAFTVKASETRVNTSNPTQIGMVTTPAVVVTAPVVSIAATSSGEQEIVVRMPMPPANVTAAYDGDVCIKTTGFTTNTLPFRYQPASVPGIWDVTTMPAKPGQMLTIGGGNFASTDELHLVLAGGNDVTVPMTFVSTEVARMTVPPYTARESVAALLYMKRTQNGLQFVSRPFTVWLLPTEMNITSLSTTQVAGGDPVLITGYGFTSMPLVTFTANGVPSGAKVNLFSETVISVEVPRITRVRSPIPVQVIVSIDGRKSSPLSLTFVPTYLHTVLRTAGKPWQYDVQFGDRNVTDNIAAASDYSLWGSSDVDFTVMGYHNTTKYIYFGSSGYDDYFEHISLNNGWMLERIVLTIDERTTAAGAYFDRTGEGTPSCRARVRWWGDMGGYVHYYISFLATGPAGYSPYEGLL